MKPENHKINNEALKYYRSKKAYTQADLANECKVGAISVYRWETGNYNPKFEHQKKIVKVLGITLEKLREPPPAKENTESRKNSSISVSSNVALDIISDTYHINKEAIIDFAPFLFHAVAAASLGKRASCVDEMYEELKALREFSMEKLPFIASGVRVEEERDGQSLCVEREAIEKNQLFYSDAYDIPDDANDISANPFSQFIKPIIDSMPDNLNNIFDFEWRNDELPKFRITDFYIREILRVPIDDDLLKKIMELILNGVMQLKDIDYRSGLSNDFIEKNKEDIIEEIREKVMEKYTELETSKQFDSGEGK